MSEAEVEVPDAWFRDGLRFECTQCGNCCTGGPGAVWFSPAEGRAMAAAVGLDEAEFLSRYTRSIGVRRSLNERRTEHGFDCVFLDRSTVPGKAVCGLYHARPSQCRTWPFWAENIESPEAWAATKARTPCPGMGRGRLHGYVEITVQRDLDRKREAYEDAS